MTNFDTPTNRSRWTPADDSGMALANEETGEEISLTYAQAYGVLGHFAERALDLADEAIDRLNYRTLDLSHERTGERDLDLSFGHTETDESDAALLARWDGQR